MCAASALPRKYGHTIMAKTAFQKVTLMNPIVNNQPMNHTGAPLQTEALEHLFSDIMI